MTAAALLGAVLADLQTFATANKGKGVLAKDPFHALQILCTAPAGFHLVVQDDGEAPTPGTDETDPIHDLSFSLFASFNIGLKADPAEDLLEDRGDRPSLVKLCGEITDRVMTKGHATGADPADKIHAVFITRDPVTTPDGIPLAAYRLRFKITYALPALTYRDS